MTSREAARRLRKSRPFLLGLGLLLALLLLALLGPLVLAHDPDTSDFAVTRGPLGAPPGPSLAHPLGTDALHRDVLARLAHGARLSLGIALGASLLSTLLGAVVGLASGFTAGGRLRAVDAALMRLTDVLLALPYLLFVTALGVAVGRADALTVLLVLGLSGWGGAARVVRARTMQIRERAFVEAARALGTRPLEILRRHVVPNVSGALLVLATTSAGQMMLAEAVLGYLTVGVQPPAATWGRMLHEAEPFLFTRLPLLAAPGLCILLGVLAFGRLGDGLRDALDPSSVAAPPGRLPADLLLTLAVLLLVAVASPNRVRPPLGAETPEARPARGGWLHVATFVNVRPLDPALAYDEVATAIEGLVFARLVTYDRAGNVIPELAREVRVSDDGRRYSFVLRDGVRFHDGAEMRADDVRRSLERTLHPRTPSPAASQYAMIEGFEEFRSGRAPHLAGVRVLGERTVEITLAHPDNTFLPLLTRAFAAPVCPSSGTFVDPSRPVEPCGAGPFRLASWEGDGTIRLIRHESYFEPGKPYLDGIVWSTNERPLAQRYKFEDGALDYLRDTSSSDAALFRADPHWSGRLRRSPAHATNAIFMNTEMPPFDLRGVRRAVAMAIDPSVLEQVRAEVKATDRVLPEGIPGPDRKVPMRRHDLRAALAEMERAGFAFDPATGRGGYPRPIDYIAPSDTFEQQAAEVYQQQLSRIGIRIRLRLLSYATYQAEVSRRRTSPMGWAGWKADFPDPSNFFEPTLASSAIADEGSQNYAFFKSQELDEVLDRAHAEPDRQARMRLYARAEEIVRDEAPWAPTYEPQMIELWQPYVRGYEPHPVLPQRFNDVWLDPSAHVARVDPLGPSSLLAPASGARP